ncbi:MAG TPA: hypothetical protein VG797_06170 [Phycisphaerales bacterium]|nr:hypothetical protein [Phycisphaerales bacterium]
MAAVVVGLVVLGGCVEERSSSRLSYRGVPVKPASAGSAAGANRTPQAPTSPGKTAAAKPVELPEGPITEAPDSAETSNAHVRVAVVPLGTVPFDGTTLPVVSPDGRFVAVQMGEPPAWEQVLASPSATGMCRTTVEIYELGSKGPAKVEPVETLPTGLLLGRSADSEGVLVEYPRADGSRWIGRIEWAGARLAWIARGNECAAHAVSLRGGVIAYARRGISEDHWSVHIGGRDETVALPDGCTAAFPMPSDRPDLVHVICTSNRGIELLAFRIPGRDQPSQRPFMLNSAVLSASPDPLSAHLAASVVQPLVRERHGDVTGESTLDPLLFFHPGSKRMAAFSPTSGRVTLLAPGSISASELMDPVSGEGVLLTVEKSLVHQRLSMGPDGVLKASQPATVLGEPYVPRETMNPERPYVLIGPVRTDPTRLQLLAMRLAE